MPPALGRRHEYAGPTLFSYGSAHSSSAVRYGLRSGSCYGCRNISANCRCPRHSHRSTGISMRCSSDPGGDCHRLPADRNSELDRAAAGQRLSVGRPRRALAGGSRSGGWFCDLGRWARRRDRRRLPRYAGGGGVARDRRRQQLAQPPCPIVLGVLIVSN